MEQPTNAQPISQHEAVEISVRAGQVFKPRTPINTRELFAGRWEQITTLVDAVSQTGLHVVIYGERGVGKTSLANVVQPTIHFFDQQQGATGTPAKRLVVKVNAHSEDDFSSIWHKVFGEIAWSEDRPAYGFGPGRSREAKSVAEVFNLGEAMTVDEVRRTIAHMGGSVCIIDEFDRAACKASKHFTDLIKALSDFGIDCTVVLVGVSDTVDELVSDHASIGRALVQVMLPRMKPKELAEILEKAESELKVGFASEARDLIVHMSQGLPHYTHLLGLHSVRDAANQDRSRQVEATNVYHSLDQAVKQAQQSVTEKHSKATHSAHPDALYQQVLLACALTAARTSDPLGYFHPAAVTEPLQAILDRPKAVQIATFNSHLSDFCQDKRGGALERTGQPRSYRYRFRDPLLVPYTFMDAIACGMVKPEQLRQLLTGNRFT